MEKKPKWLTNLLGGIGAALVILQIWKPEIFSPELNNIILTSVTSIGLAVLSIVAWFGAKDELKMENFF